MNTSRSTSSKGLSSEEERSAMIEKIWELDEEVEAKDKEIKSLKKQVQSYKAKMEEITDQVQDVCYHVDLALDSVKEVEEVLDEAN